MPDAINRRLAALEAKKTDGLPKLLVFDELRDTDFETWRGTHVVPLEAQGHRPLVVILRRFSEKPAA